MPIRLFIKTIDCLAYITNYILRVIRNANMLLLNAQRRLGVRSLFLKILFFLGVNLSALLNALIPYPLSCSIEFDYTVVPK